MRAEFEKKMLISSELLSYCHLKGADEFHLDVKVTAGGTVFAIKASPAHVSDEEMAFVRKELNAPRQREMEQDFWGLGGESENASELTLIGMMTDEAAVECGGGVLSVTLTRLP